MLATAPPLPPWKKPPPLPLGHVVGPVVKVPGHTVVIGGMPGSRIALIATGAALLAAVLAVIADRARAARRRPMAAAWAMTTAPPAPAAVHTHRCCPKAQP